MIRRQWPPDKWLLIPQVEHSRVSGLIAASWNFAGRKPHRDLLHAISHHDDGWRTFDEEPSTNAAGDPLSFMEMAPEVSTMLWSGSIRNLEADKKFYGARVVGQHFCDLCSMNHDLGRTSPRGAAALGAFIGAQNYALGRYRATAAQELHDSATIFEDSADMPAQETDPLEAFATDVRFLQVVDMISLLLCTEFTGETVIENVPYLEETDTLKVSRNGDGKLALKIDPLPFRRNLRDHVTGLVVPRKRYAVDEELREACAAAKPLVVEWHIGAISG